MAPRPAPKKKKGLPEINHRLAAIAAALVVIVGAGVAIQVFGDPSAAGPHRIIALNPAAASAESAPRMSFSEAAAEGSEIQPTDLNASPLPAGADAPDDGQVHVAMVNSDNAT